MNGGVSEKTRQALITKFRAIAQNRVQKLSSYLLDLEKDPDNEALVAETLREIHTLKGEAKLMGFADINLVAHRTEELFIAIKKQRYRLQEDLPDLILGGLDIISALLAKKPGTDQESVDLDLFVRRVKEALEADDRAAGKGEPSRGEAPRGEPPRGEPLRGEPAPPAAAPGEQPAPRVPHHWRGPLAVGEHHAIQVQLDKIERLTDLVGILLTGQATLEEAIRPFGRFVETLEEHMGQLRGALRGLRRVPAIPAGRSPEAHARMLGERLEDARTYCRHMFDQLTDARTLVATAFEESFTQQICVNELEEAIRELRLIPLGTLFESYRRAVRDMAREQGKRARIEITGGEVEVDKQVFDEMSETLLHLIRNSVDHGIESPEQRRAQGKQEEGTILLAARQYGAVVELKIQDDGGGLDTELIRRTAVKRQELTADEAGRLDEGGVVDLIFRSGFSTKPEATDISGRGVGLNVVKQRIESMGGTLKVISEPQLGTIFLLTVPVSVTLTRAVMVECSGRRYAVHSESVLLVTDVEGTEIQKAGKQQIISIDEEPIALEDLCLLLGGPPAMVPAEGSNIVMVLRYGDRKLGVRVDRHLGEREVLLKALDPFLEGLRMVSGSTVLEQGDIALLVNVPELMRQAGKQTSWSYAQQAPATVSVEKVVLVAEDSELTRDFLVEVLRTSGYRVIEAMDGQDAIKQMGDVTPSLVISDLDMPIMDGLELVKRIRATKSMRDLPVIIFTTHGSEADRRRALEAGANAYLVKTAFREETFINTIESLIGKPKGTSA